MEYPSRHTRAMKWVIVPLLTALAATVIYALRDNDLNEPYSPSTRDRYDLHTLCKDLIQKQVNEEMHASLVYMKMAAHFAKNSVARKGFQKFFEENSKEEREHANKLIGYLSRRGASFSNFDISMPEDKAGWMNALDALQDALALEKKVNNLLHSLHERAERTCKDPHLMDFLESEYLEEQVESIDNIYRLISMLQAMDTGTGEYLVDQQLLNEK